MSLERLAQPGKDVILRATPSEGVLPAFLAFGALREEGGDPAAYLLLSRDGRVVYAGGSTDYDPMLYAVMLVWLQTTGMKMDPDGVYLAASAGFLGGVPGRVVFESPSGQLVFTAEGCNDPNPAMALTQWAIDALLGMAA